MKAHVPLLFVLAVPVHAAPRTVADSFQQLVAREVLNEGETILIEYTQNGGDEYAEVRGSFVSLTDSTITITPESAPQMELAEHDVHRIERELKDTVWKGAFIGGGVGLGYGAFSMAAFCNSAWECGAGETAGTILVTTGIGFAVGALIDSARGKTKQELVYVEDPPASTSVNVSVFPILSPTRGGLGISVRW